MHKSLLRSLGRACVAILFILCATHVWSQDFKNGIRQDIVKVKFSGSVSETVSRMQISSTPTGLRTGMEKLDAAASRIGAKTMYRLFPYDAKHESRLRSHGLHLWYVVELDGKTDPRAAMLALKQLKEIEVAEVEREKIISPYQVIPHNTSDAGTYSTMPFNDPYLKDQWHYDNRAQSGFGDADINLFEAWQTTTGASNIIVSVHDEGVDVKHEDLKANIWVNTGEIANNGIDDDANGYIDDINGFNFSKNKGAIDAQHHGTHVAGTIAAVNNNGKGVSGVAGGNGSGNGVKIMSMQILGGGLIERSYIYAAHNGALISQNSWGYSTDGYFDQSVLDAIKYFIAEAGNFPGSPMRGGIVIFASGNSNLDGYWYPARYPSVLSVSAIGPEWNKAAYSNYGTWVDISAPGGDQITYGSINGVLSTIPGNKYAYMQGTSMACPHVSGVAALVLANSSSQITPSELWTKLLTGVVSIDAHNEDYIGTLGSGAIDASLAIRNDQHIGPSAITDLDVDGIAQEFATLSWTVPSDEDDNHPVSFTLYYHTEPLSHQNLQQAKSVVLKNILQQGETMTHEVADLLGLTTYYFAITSTDRWGNVSDISNVASASTNEGPAISVTPETFELNVDASVSTTASTEIEIKNNGAGILRWEHFLRHRASTEAFNISGIRYPQKASNQSNALNVGRANSTSVKTLEQPRAVTASFESIEKSLSDYPTNIVGETNTTFPNSAAGRFYVTEEDGFNLTDVSMYLKHNPDYGPVVLEVYGGTSPTRDNLLYAQEYVSYTTDQVWATITLDEQIYFEKGSTFWLVFHIPSGNLFPLGIGFEKSAESSTNCFYSVDVGTTWQPLELALNDKEFAWVMSAWSYNAFLGTYVTLDPGSGDIAAHMQSVVSLNADASALINGEYSANLVIKSNDGAAQEVRVPLNLTVTGHAPQINHVDIADFGAVFVGEEKFFDILLDNQGYGSLTNISTEIGGDGFEVETSPNSVAARGQGVVRVKFTPTSPGNKNAVLAIAGDSHVYTIQLFGVGSETSKIKITPENQSRNDVAIGDVVTSQITIENTGAYPLKYFIPGFDNKGVSENWPTSYHKYGYELRSSRSTEKNPIAYDFQDISATGVDITQSLIKDEAYFELDLGFAFPYYGKAMHTLYIAQKGFTTFDKSVRPINTPTVGNPSSPAGYISLLGTWLTYISEGKIFYKKEADRVIIQYHNVTDGYAGHLTAQMVLFYNGDIRFYYEDMGYDPSWQTYLNILIEDLDHSDGIRIHDYLKPIELYSGLALGLDYPGPNIITSVENGSGILAPGATATVDVTLNTESLAEGTVKRYINFISNDPDNRQKSALIELNITSGGVADAVYSTEEIDFGDVFQGAIRSTSFTIKNAGSADVKITDVQTINGAFGVAGNFPVTIKPGLFQTYEVSIPTDVLANLTDEVMISYTDGTSHLIPVTGNVVAPPGVDVDLSALNETLAYGEKKAIPFAVKNTGTADLKVSMAGHPWAYFESPSTSSSFSYALKKENSGGVYQWLDIRRTGVQLPFAPEIQDENQYWRKITLPFEFNYFGEDYSELKIGENGVIAFEESPEVMLFPDSIPSAIFEGSYLMPYWVTSSFDTYHYKAEDVGIFYQNFDDKIVITWSHLVNFFGGMGDPVSAQVILFKNGQIRFQYKVEDGGSDQTSHSTMIGLQGGSTAIMISDKLALDHGKGLAYDLIPANEFVIAPTASLSGNIVFDATHTYAGSYESTLNIFTNVPGKELLEKPVSLVIEGTNELSVSDEIDFGTKVIAVDNGLPGAYPHDVEIVNSGTTPLDITWIETSTPEQPLSLQVYALIDGWFGPMWEWVDISQLFSPWASPTPVFQIMPGDRLNARAVFYPTTPGEFSNEVILTTTAGEKRITLTGTAVEPPVINISDAPIEVQLNTFTETEQRTIALDNMDGKSDLEYTVNISFDRVLPARVTETTAATPLSTGSVRIDDTPVKSGIQVSAAYNRTLKHTERTSPDNHAGNAGSAPFTVATRFNAGNRGFNLSHIETWFRAESFTEGTLEVEVRAGANTITEAATVSQATLQFSRSGEDTQGNWIQLALPEPVFLYPNEEFFVIVTFPFGINFPQGIVRNESTIPGRYLYYEDGVWDDIQTEEGFLTTAWLMYAGEETEQTSSWISIVSDSESNLAPGGAGSIDIKFEGAFASRGDQRANVIVTTNDPAQPQIVIPVKLHMNEAPVFSNVPDEVLVNENEERLVKINVIDSEGHDVSVAPAEPYEDLSFTFEDGVLSVTVTGQTPGNYAYTFTAEDEYEAESSVTLHVVVQHTNKAPVYVGEEEFELTPDGDFIEYDINDYFEDPDGDAISFTCSSSDNDKLEVFASQSKFLVKATKPGTVTLTFTGTDSHGASTTVVIPVTINVVLSAEKHRYQFKAYPNPVRDVLTVEFGDRFGTKKEVRIIDSTGRMCKKMETTNETEFIDVRDLRSGVYMLYILSEKNTSFKKLVVK